MNESIGSGSCHSAKIDHVVNTEDGLKLEFQELQPSPVTLCRRFGQRRSSLRQKTASLGSCALIIVSIIASIANIVAIIALFHVNDGFFIDRPPVSETEVLTSNSYSTTTLATVDVPKQSESLPHCGSSVVDAKANGCHFDPMMNGWIPDECHFPHLLPEFMPGESWYYDQEREHEIPIDVLLRGELEFYYPVKMHHARHCLYTWRKLLWAFADNRLLDDFSASVHHTSHCNDMVDPSKKMNVTQKSNLGFRRCVRVGHREP